MCAMSVGRRLLLRFRVDILLAVDFVLDLQFPLHQLQMPLARPELQPSVAKLINCPLQLHLADYWYADVDAHLVRFC